MNIFQKVKALFAFNSAFNQLEEAYMTSHSWFSTRFWLTAITVGTTLWASVKGFVPQPYATYVEVGAGGLYVIVETVRKVMDQINATKAAAAAAAAVPAPTAAGPVAA